MEQMGSNFFEEYELIDGWAIVDNSFEIISANETYYRFVGISRCYTLTDVIHQVDLDDFIEVANSLKTDMTKSVVIRMRRVDNSYRWVLMDVRRSELHSHVKNSPENKIYEYLELKMSDIKTMRSENARLKQRMKEYNHLLALEGELVFSVDCHEKRFVLYRFVDEELSVIDDRPVVEVEAEYRNNNLIPADDMPEFDALCDDINSGAEKFVHTLRINTTSFQVIGGGCMEFKGSTYYIDGKKSSITGTIKKLDGDEGFSRSLAAHGGGYEDLTDSSVLNYVKNNMRFNPSGEIMLMLLQIDDLDRIEEKYGKDTADRTFNYVFDMCREKVGYRGVVGTKDRDVIYMAIKGVNAEVNTRAFIESLRTMIKWKYRLLNNEFEITFSIGVSRYPFNGKDYDKMVIKAQNALELANIKGKNRFIIYKEMLHGEL